jgi:hypothetical protein
VVGVRLLVACMALALIREWQHIRWQKRVLNLIALEGTSMHEIRHALQMEEHAKYKASLGDADCQTARALIWRAGDDLDLARRVASHLRVGSSWVEGGQVKTAVRQRIASIVLFAAVAVGWLLFMASLIPSIWDDPGSLAMYLVVEATLVAYVLSPIVGSLRSEIATRNQINTKARLRPLR